MKKFPRWLVAAALLLALFWWVARSRSPSIAQGSLLVIELSGRYVDGPVPLLSRLRGEPVQSLLSLTSELRKAARDERLDGVVFRVRSLELGWAQAEEIRQAILRLREKGKRTVAVLEFEGFGNAPYYLASAADHVVATPGGNSPFVGSPPSTSSSAACSRSSAWTSSTSASASTRAPSRATPRRRCRRRTARRPTR